jgi:signal transduction histidine kinase
LKVVVLAIVCVVATLCGCGERNVEGTKAGHPKRAGIDSLVDVAFDLQYNNPQASDSLAGVVMFLSQKEGYKKGIAHAWFLKSSVQQQLGNYDSAIILAEVSLNLFTKINDKVGIARCYNDIGINYDFKAYYDSAITYYLQALVLYDEQNDTRGKTNAYNNIGLIYQNQGNYKDADINYRKAYSIAAQNNHEDARLNALNNMGSNFLSLGNYDSALKCFNEVLAEDLKTGNKSYISYSYNNVGEAYLGLGNYDDARVFLNKSKVLKEELGNKRAQANTLKNLGELSFKTYEYDDAVKYLTEAQQIATELGVPEIQKECYDLMQRLSAQKGDYKAALEFYKKSDQIKDEISYDKKDAEISKLIKDFEVEKARNQVAKSKQTSQANRLLSLVYGCIIILLLLILGTVWVVLRQKQKTQEAMQQYQNKLEEQNKVLEEKNDQIHQQKKELEIALAARVRFLSFMSHEIRTPLNGIAGIVGLLETQPMLPEQEEFLEALKQSSDNLMLLLNNILDLSRLEIGKVEIESIAVDINKLLHQQATMYKASAMLRSTTFEVIVDENIPAKLLGDPYRISQIMANLIGNAIKFTRNGAIVLQCKLVENIDDTVKVMFEVADTGVGIPDDQLENIMLPFTQAETYTTRKYGGTGLGLTIVNLLLKLMNSQLQVVSKLGEGTRFYFTLTLPIYKAPLLSEGPMPNKEVTEGLKGKKILVVEDNTTNVLLITRLLANWQTEYDLADNGYKAIEFAEQKQYDIILMDLHLPKMSGYEAAEKIRNQVVLNKTTPILAITAADENEVKNHPLRTFLTKVMHKPVKYETLAQTIQQVINTSK